MYPGYQGPTYFHKGPTIFHQGSRLKFTQARRPPQTHHILPHQKHTA